MSVTPPVPFNQFPQVPITVPQGKAIVWSLSQSFAYVPGTTPGNVAADVSQLGGGISVGQGIPGSGGASCQWGSFNIPTVPAGSTITAIQACCYGISTGSINGSSISNHFASGIPFQAGPYDKWFIGSSIGTTLTSIPGLSFSCGAGNSLNFEPGGGYVGFKFIGVAVIFTPPARRPVQTWVSIGNTRVPK